MYEKTIKLRENEVAAKLNIETGEVSEIPVSRNNIPSGKILFNPNAYFNKMYPKSWNYLKSKLSPFEFNVAFELALMAKANTNSLEPLSDDVTINQLTERFCISRNKVKPLFTKLFKLGVYGKFEIYDTTKPYTKYWILNPYLCFTGKLIHSDIANLFKGTDIAIHFLKDPI